jgi:hypothetical protein
MYGFGKSFLVNLRLTPGACCVKSVKAACPVSNPEAWTIEHDAAKQSHAIAPPVSNLVEEVITETHDNKRWLEYNIFEKHL